MSELLDAAKAVIDLFDDNFSVADCEHIDQLRAAVERAEFSQPVRLSDVEISALMNNVTGLATYSGYKLFAEKIMDAMMEKNK